MYIFNLKAIQEAETGESLWLTDCSPNQIHELQGQWDIWSQGNEMEPDKA